MKMNNRSIYYDSDGSLEEMELRLGFNPKDTSTASLGATSGYVDIPEHDIRLARTKAQKAAELKAEKEEAEGYLSQRDFESGSY